MDWGSVGMLVVGSLLTLVVQQVGAFFSNREARKHAADGRSHERTMADDAHRRALDDEERRAKAEHGTSQRELFRALVVLFDQATSAAEDNRDEQSGDSGDSLQHKLRTIRKKLLEVTDGDLRKKLFHAVAAVSWASSANSGRIYGIGEPVWPTRVRDEALDLLGYAIRGEPIPPAGAVITQIAGWISATLEAMRLEDEEIEHGIAEEERENALAKAEERHLDQDSYDSEGERPRPTIKAKTEAKASSPSTRVRAAEAPPEAPAMANEEEEDGPRARKQSRKA